MEINALLILKIFPKILLTVFPCRPRIYANKMEEIFAYVGAFAGIVAYSLDSLAGWLFWEGASGWFILIGVFVLFALNVLDRWSVEIEKRIQAVEKKLGIKHESSPKNSKTPWTKLFAWFLVAVYLLGKSLQAESSLAFFGGIALAGFMLLLCAVCTFSFVAGAVKKYWRTERIRQNSMSKEDAD